MQANRQFSKICGGRPVLKIEDGSVTNLMNSPNTLPLAFFDFSTR